MMNLQLPIFELGVLHPGVPRNQDRLGGLPSGLPPGSWPTCKQCGHFQTFLAQFALADDQTVLLFQCDSDADCETWAPEAGANASIVCRNDELDPLAGPPTSETKIAPEVLVRAWKDTQVVASASTAYRGGTPRWLSSHAREPAADDSFVLQLTDELKLDDVGVTAANSGAEILDTEGRELPLVPCEFYGWWSRGCRNRVGQPSQLSRTADGKCVVEWANFGGGTMYLFVRSDGSAYHFWER